MNKKKHELYTIYNDLQLIRFCLMLHVAQFTASSGHLDPPFFVGGLIVLIYNYYFFLISSKNSYFIKVWWKINIHLLVDGFISLYFFVFMYTLYIYICIKNRRIEHAMPLYSKIIFLLQYCSIWRDLDGAECGIDNIYLEYLI